MKKRNNEVTNQRYKRHERSHTLSVPKSFSCQAIVLRTYDVGEADRFCILFTRERGRIAARATGVRKVGSRMGGSVLPFRHLSLEIREERSGSFIRSVVPQMASHCDFSDVAAFMQAQRGVELLLSLVPHEEPDPVVFEAVLAFLYSCSSPSPAGILSFTFRLLALLGFLPEDTHLHGLVSLDADALTFIAVAREGRRCAEVPASSLHCLERLSRLLLSDHLSAPLKAEGVAAAMC